MRRCSGLLGQSTSWSRSRSGQCCARGVFGAEAYYTLTVVRETVPDAWGWLCMAGAGIILAAGAALDRRVILLTTSVAVASVVAVVLSVVLRTDPTAV